MPRRVSSTASLPATSRRAIQVSARLLLASLLAALLALQLTAAVQAVAGNTPCREDADAPLWTPRFAEGKKTAAGAVGASAYIGIVNPPLCTTSGTPAFDDDNGSFAWVGFGRSDDGKDVVQAGLVKCHWSGSSACTDSLRYFYAWGWDPSVHGCGAGTGRAATPVNAGSAGTGTHFFKVVNTGTEVQFWVDAVKVEAIPSSSICWSATGASFSGETWDRGDQLGDNYANYQSFTQALYKPSFAGVWQAPSPVCSVTYVEYFCQIVGTQTIKVWTDRR